ncbi:hypothetical protein HAZT_HAZT010751 [Hyalella azteca]|uniref:Rhomboid-related protein 4 n=1 Tax=Hyalella azteca TaxID=294128 RepID=A0A6A0GU48_HYAAZ|nr:rhomboid-related protein 4 [Hyalella azteca]KAA0188475.1 hypothetical protein HAZT_HAZT010751 [Hyalella azteca]
MRPRGGVRALGVGILLLAYRIMSAGLQYIPPVTLALILLQAALFTGVLNPPWTSDTVCLSAQSVLVWGDYRRLLLAALEHTSDMHLYYNMSSLLIKGVSQEKRLGSRVFFMLILLLTAATSMSYVGLMEAAARYLHPSYRTQCAIGFSGVLFALKVVSTYHESRGYETASTSLLWHLHITVPTRYAVWVELLVIHILVPRSSFAGHLAGILVGLAYVTTGFEKTLYDIDYMFRSIFLGESYTYARGRARRTRDNFEDEPGPRMRYYGRPEEYRAYSREDFNPTRNFEPMFAETSRRRRHQAAPSPSAPSAEDVHEPALPADPEELRRLRLQRFQ